jgi:hypothetical protein
MPIASEDLAAILAAQEQALESVDLSSFLGEVARPMVLQDERDHFTSSVSPDGIPWAPRVVLGDGHPILVDKGNLLQAATGGGAGHISQIGQRELVLGVRGDVSGAIYHAEGTSRMLARPSMGAKESTEEQLEEKLADYVLEHVFEN